MRNYSGHIPPSYVWIVMVLCLPTFAVSGASMYPYDFLCNNGTRHACVCYRGDGGLRGGYPDCYAFIESVNLTVVKLTVKNLDMNVEVFLDDGKKVDNKSRSTMFFEEYFRIILSQTISFKCENLANRCPGIGISVTNDRIVVLRARCGSQNYTEILFTVTEGVKVSQLNQNNIMNADLIVTFLEQEQKSLNAKLRSATLTDIDTETITIFREDKPPSAFKRNYRLIVGLIIVGGFMTTTYIIAIYKVIRDTWAKRRKEASLMANSKDKKKNYGSVSNNLHPPPPPVPRASELITRSRSNLNRIEETNIEALFPSVLPNSDSNHRVAVVEVEPVRRAAPPPPTSRNDLKTRSGSHPDFPELASPSESNTDLNHHPHRSPVFIQQPSDHHLFSSSAVIPANFPMRKAISSTSFAKIEEEPIKEAEEDVTMNGYAGGGPPPSALLRSATLDEGELKGRNSTQARKGELSEESEEDEDLSGEEGEPGNGYRTLSPTGSVPDFIKELTEASEQAPTIEVDPPSPSPSALNGYHRDSEGETGTEDGVTIRVHPALPDYEDTESEVNSSQSSPYSNNSGRRQPSGRGTGGMGGGGGVLLVDEENMRISQQCLVLGDEVDGSSCSENEAKKPTDGNAVIGGGKRRRRHPSKKICLDGSNTSSSESVCSGGSRNSGLGLMDYERLAESGWSLNAMERDTQPPPSLTQVEVQDRDESSSPDIR